MKKDAKPCGPGQQFARGRGDRIRTNALLGNKGDALAEAKRVTEMLPTAKDALIGPGVLMNLAVVYAWTNELDLAFETLIPLAKIPNGIYYGQLKRDPYWNL